ncbi:DNA double-strand break repair nuclease NurA [cf. Phormidesmis sp. LEGE 11477]|uniref:DNA double-strand break repair nuclease NurA n=1 Tax=cf. Phormidesmis sp. LEGE 11477 TaxID=1828680 RepID=UPI00187FE93F|nr:DNA double-strand break repair nuclease NurA [cf. Phormidesmis sp. LEGE 11477]MBE9063262.1 DNA double-strand break repair nuclease NurA [cf. Phormidesmis sp. LEGE 11477]
MAIKPSQIQSVLNSKRADFSSFNASTSSYLTQYRTAWDEWIKLPSAKRDRWIQAQSGDIGARPLEPISSKNHSIVRSYLQWENREQSLEWARQHLSDVTTFAVDGSQVFPQKDFSIPIALVQIGWFENHHCAAGTYEKDILLDVMTPKDLVADRSQPMDRWINMRRFSMEVQKLTDYIKQAKDRAVEQGRDPEKCLVFYDGSLVLSFAAMLEDNIRAPYIEKVLTLLQASEKYQVPLVGYVDTAESNDIVTLLRTFHDLDKSRAIHDAKLLNSLMQWGDRTPIMICDRGGILNEYREMQDRLTFTYLKTNAGYPARLELPRWIWSAGLADTVIDQVRAEVIVGNGYPYVIETADQTAVLQSRDRQIFYRILQDWAAEEQLQLSLSQKMMSKARRRG